jgi:hypothetical protein
MDNPLFKRYIFNNNKPYMECVGYSNGKINCDSRPPWETIGHHGFSADNISMTRVCYEDEVKHPVGRIDKVIKCRRPVRGSGEKSRKWKCFGTRSFDPNERTTCESRGSMLKGLLLYVVNDKSGRDIQIEY